ncbi:MAG: exodeoxyribonuclease VII small subunit [Phycisphaerales bacterium]|jgi:exodeoxyribonuclease VII small subunit|nr:exodeoxyribonuclease VII small subunit [Phycisphaerales bacterium]
MARKNQTPPKNFEEAQAELETIVTEIENSQIGLEESLQKYERGTFLIQYCQNVLKKAEQQIELLSKSPEGGLQADPMPDESSDSSDA